MRNLGRSQGGKLSLRILGSLQDHGGAANSVNVGLQAYAGGKNEVHRTTLAMPHNIAQMTYTLPHRGRSTSRVAAAQYVLGSDGSKRSAICVCA
jgi:hypothetical protein